MKNRQFINLFFKEKTGRLNSDEAQVLKDLEIENPDLARATRKSWDLSGTYDPPYHPDVEAGLAKLKDRIKLEGNISSQRKSTGKLFSLLSRVAAVAAMIFIVGFLARTFLQPSSQPFIVSTTTGQLESIELMDGSTVHLNENSSLEFLNPNNKTERRALLRGEAFFEVAKDPSKPFIIETPESSIEVLGTSFNVRAIPGESFTEVQVKTGKVSFKSNQIEKGILLEANQKGVLNSKQSQLEKTEDASLNALAWHSKTLRFNNTPLKKVLDDLERYYQINVEITEAKLKDCGFTSPFVDQDAELVLQTLSSAFEMELEKVNNTNFRLRGGVCK